MVGQKIDPNTGSNPKDSKVIRYNFFHDSSETMGKGVKLVLQTLDLVCRSEVPAKIL